MQTIFKIATIPDFLSDHTLLNSELEQRITEHCSRWCLLIGSLWTQSQPSPTIGLRFHWLPDLGQISTELIVNTPNEEQQYSKHVEHTLKSFNIYPVIDNTPKLKNKFEDYEHIIEIRQHEDAVYIDQLNELKYLINPFWGPGGSFQPPFWSMVEQKNHPVIVQWHLQPVNSLTEEERNYIADLAIGGKTYEDLQETHRIEEITRRISDPQAAWVGRINAANLRRLSHPFLIQGFSISNDYQSAKSVAGSFVSTISESRPFDPPLGENEVLQSQAETIECPIELKTIVLEKLNNTDFIFDIPDKIEIGSDKPPERLKYLSDARGAATAFRLPVNVRGGIPGLTIKQSPPVFHPGPLGISVEHENNSERYLNIGTLIPSGQANIPIKELTKHILITGFTGSGKTWTVLSILDQLWNDHKIPFWVIESSKNEYRGIITAKRYVESAKIRQKQDQISHVRVYTLGDETTSPFRLNPFELLPCVRVESHVSRLQTCFEGALPPIPPLISMIHEALIYVYEQHGWSLDDVMPKSGKCLRRFPVMTDFSNAMEQIIVKRQYKGDVLHNVKAAVLGRIKPLVSGSKGKMFGSMRSSPSLSTLFDAPVIFEMNDLNLEDKALLTMFLLTVLREYREHKKDSTLCHVTVVEEAHNVLEDVGSTGGNESHADTRHKTVQAFCSMLTEIRALGEGLVIADQSPEKLAQDAIRNTNLQIAHQLRDSEDRMSVARAMIMDDDQVNFLGKLPPGKASVFYTGLEKATIVTIPPYMNATSKNNGETEECRGLGFQDKYSNKELSMYMTKNKLGIAKIPEFVGCQVCQIGKQQCEYRDFTTSIIFKSVTLQENFLKYALNLKHAEKEIREQSLMIAIKIARKCAERAHAEYSHVYTDNNVDTRLLAWCSFVYLLKSSSQKNPKANQPIDFYLKVKPCV